MNGLLMAGALLAATINPAQQRACSVAAASQLPHNAKALGRPIVTAGATSLTPDALLVRVNFIIAGVRETWTFRCNMIGGEAQVNRVL